MSGMEGREQEMRTGQETCDAIEPLLAPWAEGRTGPDESARVEAHLLACRRCRTDAEAGRAVHALLRERAASLRDHASDSLRAAVVPAASRIPPVAASRRVVPRWAPLAAAAALVVAIVGGAFSERGSLFAAQLALDHLKCVVLKHSHYEGDVPQLEQAWQTSQGWHVEIPSGAGAGLRLVALRQCLASHGQMAHVMYDRAGRTLSLFILQDAARDTGELEIMGYSTATRTRDDRTYALVADVPPEEAAALLESLLAELH